MESTKTTTCVGTAMDNIHGNYEHAIHIDKKSTNINMVCASLNNITDLLCSSFRSIEKNQEIDQNYLKAILKSIESKV